MFLRIHTPEIPPFYAMKTMSQPAVSSSMFQRSIADDPGPSSQIARARRRNPPHASCGGCHRAHAPPDQPRPCGMTMTTLARPALQGRAPDIRPLSDPPRTATTFPGPTTGSEVARRKRQAIEHSDVVAEKPSAAAPMIGDGIGVMRTWNAATSILDERFTSSTQFTDRGGGRRPNRTVRADVRKPR